jgi:hypothetical protein
MNLEVLMKEWHGVEIENIRLPEHIVDWLNEKVGDGHWFIKGNWGSQTIYFDNEKTHFLFLMTWGK